MDGAVRKVVSEKETFPRINPQVFYKLSSFNTRQQQGLGSLRGLTKAVGGLQGITLHYAHWAPCKQHPWKCAPLDPVCKLS